MPLTVAGALNMDVFNKCRLLTGEPGLENEILWVNILEILDDLSHIEPGEFLITTAHDFNTQSPNRQQGLIELFAARKLAAVAIQTGHYVEKIPQSFINFAIKYSIPLIEIPADVSFKNITRALMNRLIQEAHEEKSDPLEMERENRLDLQIQAMKNLWLKLMNSEKPEDLHLEMKNFNLIPQDPVAVVVIYFSAGEETLTSLPGEVRHKLLTQAEPVVLRILRQYHVAFLIGPSDRYLLLLLQPGRFRSDYRVFKKELVQRLLDELRIFFPERKLLAGVSCLHADLGNLKPALSEAEKALQAGELNLVNYEGSIFYRELGIFRLIMDVKNLETLKCYFYETTAPLLDYDRNCEGALIDTLKKYLESGSIKSSAERLYIHRHTMKYRLEQIHRLTGLNPFIKEDALQLNIGLNIYNYLCSLGMLP